MPLESATIFLKIVVIDQYIFKWSDLGYRRRDAVFDSSLKPFPIPDLGENRMSPPTALV